MPSASIANLRTGIDRTRRFGVLEIDRLYSLVNAYVNDAGRVVKRPGLIGTPATIACRGLFGFRGKLHTFAATPQANPSPALLVINVLRHPTGGAAALATVHSVSLVLGALYVVAEFADGVVKHYWLQPAVTWTASTRVDRVDYLQPTVPNGYVYEVANESTVNMWEANKTYVAPNQVQPTGYTGLGYQVTATTGANAKSGDTEPAWPLEVGQTVTEVRLVAGTPPVTPTVSQPAAAPSPPSTPPPQPSGPTRGRYEIPRREGPKKMLL